MFWQPCAKRTAHKPENAVHISQNRLFEKIIEPSNSGEIGFDDKCQGVKVMEPSNNWHEDSIGPEWSDLYNLVVVTRGTKFVESSNSGD